MGDPSRSRAAERFMFSAAAIVPAAFVFEYAWPVRVVLKQVEIAAAFGLAASGVLLAIGFYNVSAWRRKRRQELAYERWKWEEVTKRMNALLSGEASRPPLPTTGDAFARIVPRPDPGPEVDLQRLLIGAMTLMLKHPHLSIDAGTLRMLSRKPPRTRGRDGRYQSGRA